MPDLPEISVLIPLYRGLNTIKACLESVVSQTGVRVELFLLDNGCPEKTGEWAGYFLSQQNGIKWRLIEEPSNIGFASAMNRLYGETSSPYILFLNQDVELASDHLSKLVDALSRHADWGGVGGTLYRQSGASARTIDTSGHVIFRDRIVRNRGAGKPVETGADDFPEGEVFGLLAACAMYRREALEASREEEGPFDQDFFAYFEDIDLDYRIHRSGWKLCHVPGATGTHALGGSGGRKEARIRIRAYANRWRILWKHESIGSLWPDAGPILAQDVFSFFRAIFTDPLAWLVGPWVLIFSMGKVIGRRARMDRKWGTDRSWIRKWLRPESERISRN